MARRRKHKELEDVSVQEGIEAMLDDPQAIHWFPIRHFSPACALHVDRLIRQIRPAAVLVEGPSDASELIPYMIAPETRAPFTVFSYYTDTRNTFALNGVLSPNPDIPARYRGWWPMTDTSPELAALRAGDAVGAQLAFIDLPLHALIPFHHARLNLTERVLEDAHLDGNAYFAALAQHQRRPSFDAFWDANVEAGGWSLSTARFRRLVSTFAWCARASMQSQGLRGALVRDGTLVREAHMRYVIDQTVKTVDGPIVVVAGALHAAALPWTKRKKAKIRKDKNLETMLTAHSFRALANLYHLNRKPGYMQRVWEAMQAAPHPAGPPTHSAPDDAPPEALGEAQEALEGDQEAPEAVQAAPDEAQEAPEDAQASDDNANAASADQPLRPFDDAAMRCLLEVMRKARAQGEAVSTADAVGGWQVARNLATLRRNAEITLTDLSDAIQMAYVKGDRRLKAAGIELAAREVLVGHTIGAVTDALGQPPLMRDYYQRAKASRVDLSGGFKVVRCDVHKYKAHQLKSALLHQCDLLGVPMFVDLETGARSKRLLAARSFYKGPDLATGDNLHLITETWGVEWSEAVDDRLIEISDRGATLAQAAETTLRQELADALGDASATTRLLLRSAQMMLLDLFDELLGAVEEAVGRDTVFTHLTQALQDFTLLHTYRDQLATQGHQRLLRTVVQLYQRAALALPSIAGAQPEETGMMVDALQTLVRIAITFEGVELDRMLLIERLAEMVEDDEGNPGVRGAGFGVLFSLGATRERAIAAELRGYLMGGRQRALQAGVFLEGLFISAKNIVMSTPRLLRAINGVLGELDWETFKAILPDLRRAFTQFIPSEIDALAHQVSVEIGLDTPAEDDTPVPDGLARVGAAADARVFGVLEAWW